MFEIFHRFKVALLIGLKYFNRNWRSTVYLSLTIAVLVILQLRYDLFSLNDTSVRIGFIGTYQEHDLPPEMTGLLSRGLINPDKDGKMVGELVNGWDTNNDATIFKFKLKDLNWSDGSKLLSSDLEFSIPNTEVRYPDNKSIEFKLQEAYSPFPSLLTKPIFKKGTLMGTGPYKIKRIEKSRIFITKIVLEPTKKDLPGVVVRFYPNEKTALAGMMLGEVEVLIGVNTKAPSGAPFKTSEYSDFTKIVTIFYNTKDPFLSNRSLRQALAFSAPEISGEIKAGGPFPPISWVYNIDVKQYLGKEEEARQALDRAKDTSSDLKQEIVLTTTPQLEEVGKQVVNSWKSVGLNAVLRVESGIPQNFQALLITQSIPADPDQYFLWHSTQVATNLSKYSRECCPTSVRVDKDLEDGRKFIKEEDRKNSYFDFQRVLLEDSPATFLYFPRQRVIYLEKAGDKLNQVLPLVLD